MHHCESSGFQLLSQKGLIPHKLKPGSPRTRMCNDLYLCTTASEQDVEEKNEKEGERGGEGKKPLFTGPSVTANKDHVKI